MLQAKDFRRFKVEAYKEATKMHEDDPRLCNARELQLKKVEGATEEAAYMEKWSLDKPKKPFRHKFVRLMMGDAPIETKLGM
jgi:hypothetical protein